MAAFGTFLVTALEQRIQAAEQSRATRPQPQQDAPEGMPANFTEYVRLKRADLEGARPLSGRERAAAARESETRVMLAAPDRQVPLQHAGLFGQDLVEQIDRIIVIVTRKSVAAARVKHP